HGSLPISYDTTMLFDLFQFSSVKLRNYQQVQFIHKTTSIDEQIKEALEYEDLVPVFLKGFKESLHIETEVYELTDALWKDVIQLSDKKYAMNTWNNKKSAKIGSDMV